MEEPPGERLFTSPSSDSAEKLEKRPLAENVEVPRVGMSEIQKAISGTSGSRPPIFEARDSTLIKFNHALSLTDGA